MNSAEETVEQLVQAKYTNFSNDDVDYPSTVGLSGKSARIAPRATRASEMQSSSRKDLESKEVRVFLIKPPLTD
jgi:hypothetical protein